MLAIDTYIQHLQRQGRTDEEYFGFRSTSYSGYMKNDVFVKEMILTSCLSSYRATDRNKQALMRSAR